MSQRALENSNREGTFLPNLSHESIIFPEGVKLSNWEGVLALVRTTTTSDTVVDGTQFWPPKMARRYVVRRAVFVGTGRPIKATDDMVGEEAVVSPNGGTKFMAGKRIDDHRELKGEFLEPEYYWVHQRLGELFAPEVDMMREHFNGKGVLDASDLNISGNEWRRALGGTFLDTQSTAKAHEFDKAIVKSLNGCPRDTEHAELVWDLLKKRGVYAVNKRGDILKFVLP